MRIESSVTSVSWTPAEQETSLPALPFAFRTPRYGTPPPQRLDDLDSLREEASFCGANVLRAWIEVESGRVVDSGYGKGGGLAGLSPFDPGESTVVTPAVSFPDLRETPQLADDAVRFVQTAGGHAGFPVLRRGRGRKILRIVSPVSWTTLALTLRADGSVEHELVGASRFPRHWIYDAAGGLVEKTTELDRDAAERDAAAERTPWGDENSPALVTEAESAVERALAAEVSAAEWTPRAFKLSAGKELVRQGEGLAELKPLVYLVLDGVLAVEVDGVTVAEVGAGAVVGERALFERGVRTATLRAATPCKVLPVPADDLSRAALVELSESHRREP